MVEPEYYGLTRRIVHNEQIKTTDMGSVQLLFVDRTTLDIGPNSDLVIDNFIYEPAAGAGEISASLAKGALRFVGGQISHFGAATVSTPVATIGIRGGTATIAHGKGGTRVISHFGQITVTNECGTVVIRRTGFATTVLDRHTCPTDPARVSQAEINQYLVLLTSQRGQTGGVSSVPSDALVRQFDIGKTNGAFGPDSSPIQPQTTNVQNQVFDIIVQATQKAALTNVKTAQPPQRSSPPPPPPPPPPD